ncbi:MAG TPA: hypothetical protein VHE14_01200 [Solirubrobacteraceae bacterium]|nr:hypothetical protein [Solirubrobacteraceae bacterium]
MIDCECGETLQAANEADLRKVVAAHMQETHAAMTDDEVAQMVADRSYEATDS